MTSPHRKRRTPLRVLSAPPRSLATPSLGRAARLAGGFTASTVLQGSRQRDGRLLRIEGSRVARRGGVSEPPRPGDPARRRPRRRAGRTGSARRTGGRRGTKAPCASPTRTGDRRRDRRRGGVDQCFAGGRSGRGYPVPGTGKGDAG